MQLTCLLAFKLRLNRENPDVRNVILGEELFLVFKGTFGMRAQQASNLHDLLSKSFV